MRMTPMLQELVGLRVLKAMKVHDYRQIYFEGGAILNIHNESYVSGRALDTIDELPIDGANLALQDIRESRGKEKAN